MTKTWQRTILAVVTAVALPVVGACQMSMLETIPIQEANGETCRSAAGAYFLPKKQILLSIKQDGENSPYELVLSGTKPIADRQRIFCLDYLGSALADDTVHVNRDIHGLLQLVSSVADDKSKQIAETLIEVGVIAATGNPNFAITRSTKIRRGEDVILAEYQVDPFDREQLAELNRALAVAYGYCVIIDGHTVHPKDSQAYCNNPRGLGPAEPPSTPIFKAPPSSLELPPLPADAAIAGILYRPNLTHRMTVLRRRDPGSQKKWELFQTTQLEMPNLAPVFSIGVERSLFVKRTTRLDFDSGVLRDITIEKPSELVEFMEIPLVLAQAIVKIPAEVIKVRLASTSNQKLLIDAQRELLATQRAYAYTLRDLRDKAAQDTQSTLSGNRNLSTSGLNNSSRFRAQNIAAPGPGVAEAVTTICSVKCRGRPSSSICLAGCRTHAATCPDSPEEPEFENCMNNFRPAP